MGSDKEIAGRNIAGTIEIGSFRDGGACAAADVGPRYPFQVRPAPLAGILEHVKSGGNSAVQAGAVENRGGDWGMTRKKHLRWLRKRSLFSRGCAHELLFRFSDRGQLCPRRPFRRRA